MADGEIKAVLFDLGDTILNFGKVKTTHAFLEGARQSHAFLREQGQPIGAFWWYFARNLVRLRVKYLLSDLLRSTFKGADVQLVPLREEIDLVERYLEIEEIRFGDRLRVEIDVSPAVSEVPVPYLLLQPLVENAVRHGVAPHAEAGVVRVTAAPASGPAGRQVELTVADSGPGFPEPSLAALTDDGGVGLSNTRRRLETLYGDRHALELGGAAEGGARVTVRLPVDPDARTFDPEAVPAAAPRPE